MFFEVSPSSFHQVAEVIGAPDRRRLSISGWFHGEPIKYPPELREPAPTITPIAALASYTPTTGEDSPLDEWISRDYRRAKTLKEVRKQFEEQSRCLGFRFCDCVHLRGLAWSCTAFCVVTNTIS